MNLSSLSDMLKQQDATTAEAGTTFQNKLVVLGDAFRSRLVPLLKDWLHADCVAGTVSCTLQHPVEPSIVPGANVRLFITLVGTGRQVVVKPSASHRTGDVISLIGATPQAIYYRDGDWFAENPNGSGTPAPLTEASFETLLRRAFGQRS